MTPHRGVRMSMTDDPSKERPIRITIDLDKPIAEGATADLNVRNFLTFCTLIKLRNPRWMMPDFDLVVKDYPIFSDWHQARNLYEKVKNFNRQQLDAIEVEFTHKALSTPRPTKNMQEIFPVDSNSYRDFEDKLWKTLIEYHALFNPPVGPVHTSFAVDAGLFDIPGPTPSGKSPAPMDYTVHPSGYKAVDQLRHENAMTKKMYDQQLLSRPIIRKRLSKDEPALNALEKTLVRTVAARVMQQAEEIEYYGGESQQGDSEKA